MQLTNSSLTPGTLTKNRPTNQQQTYTSKKAYSYLFPSNMNATQGNTQNTTAQHLEQHIKPNYAH